MTSNAPDPTPDPTRAAVDAVGDPAKITRLASMIDGLAREVRELELDDAARERLVSIRDRAVEEIRSTVAPPLRDELSRIALPLEDGTPTQGELRVAHAQLAGWLEGVFNGVRMTAALQQATGGAPAQLGQRPPGLPGEETHGTYL